MRKIQQRVTTVVILETATIEKPFYIKSGNTYLNLNSNKNGITASSTKNTKWVIDDTRIRTSDNDGNIYYLNNSGTTLTIGSAGTTSWTKTDDAIYCSSAGYRYIQYDYGWRLNVAGTRTGYTIESENNYLHVTSTTTYGTGASVSEFNYQGHTLWTFSNTRNNPNGNISTTINGTTYYLNASRTGNNNNYTYTLSLSTSGITSWTNNNRKLTGNNVGLQYNNGWQGNSTGNATTLTITQRTVTVTISPLYFENTTSKVVTRTSKTKPAEFSYIPLGALQSSPFTVENGNTGYIIAGSHETDSDRKSDIRVSQYYKTNITSALTNTSNNGQINNANVKTVKNGTIQNINVNEYKRYSDAVKQLNQALSGTTNVYGLHFMNAEISINNLITAPTVLIEGKTYNNYEMPEDSIDFIVHQNGYITFFAGTYFSGNNTFFSLHVIERDSNKKITAIKEIKKIFGTAAESDDYIYQYADNSFSDGQSRTVSNNSFIKDGKTYSMKFDTTWITEPGTTNALGTTNVFYFEIPVNAGEYALGSVKGRIGAYLMYLDIGANAQLVNRATVTEKFIEITYTHKYPTGATFTNDFVSVLPSSVVPAFAGLMKETNTSISVTVDQYNDDILTVTGIDSKNDVYYVKDGKTVTLTGTPGQTIFTGGKPSKTTSVKIQRTTYYDYNIALDRYTITEVVAIRPYNNDTSNWTESTKFTINAWQATYNNGTWTKGTQIATDVTFYSPETLMEYHDAVGSVPAFYLYKVGTGENDETLRFDADVFKQIDWTDISPYRRNKLWYAVKNNSSATITYAYNNTVTISTTSAGTGTSFNDSTGQYIVNINATGSGEVRVEGERCTAIKSEN